MKCSSLSSKMEPRRALVAMGKPKRTKMGVALAARPIKVVFFKTVNIAKLNRGKIIVGVRTRRAEAWPPAEPPILTQVIMDQRV